MKTKSRSGSRKTATRATAKAKTKATPPDATSAKMEGIQETPKEMGKTIWLDTTKEHRRLYATEIRDGKLICYMDHNCIFEFTTPPQIKAIMGGSGLSLLLPADIETIAKSETLKGIYFIYTAQGGSWSGYLLERQYSQQDKWYFAEYTCQHLEQADSWLLSIPVKRLRDIRAMPYSRYATLSENEKFYWITVQERRGEDRERLSHGITRDEKFKLEEHIADYKNVLRDAFSDAGIATKKDVLQDGEQTRETVKKHGKKTPTKKVIARAKKGGEARAVIDEDHEVLILKEWEIMANTLSKNYRAKIIAQRCAKGDWKHDLKFKTSIERKDGEPITMRNVLDFINRIKPKKNDV
jgi:hypothetical protein